MKDRINYYIYLPLIFAAFLLETAFFPSLSRAMPQPQLVLLLLFASIVLSSSPDFLYMAFFLGFLFDAYFGTVPGAYMISMVLSAMFASFFKDRFMKEESIAKVVRLGIVSMLFYDLIFLALFSFHFGRTDIFEPAVLGHIALADSAYAALLVYPAARFISKGKE